VGTKAFEVAALCRPVDDRELEDFGTTQDDSGVWTFQDGSRLKASHKALPAFASADMTGYLGRCYFDVLD
jgi:hypothetical protein